MLVLFGFMALDHCTVINSVRPFLFVHKELFNSICFFCFLTWIHFEYCVSYSIGHLQICFLDQKNPLLRFLNFPKFEYCFLYTVSYIPILSVICCTELTKCLLTNLIHLYPSLQCLPQLSKKQLEGVSLRMRTFFRCSGSLVLAYLPEAFYWVHL